MAATLSNFVAISRWLQDGCKVAEWWQQDLMAPKYLRWLQGHPSICDCYMNLLQRPQDFQIFTPDPHNPKILQSPSDLGKTNTVHAISYYAILLWPCCHLAVGLQLPCSCLAVAQFCQCLSNPKSCKILQSPCSHLAVPLQSEREMTP